VLDEKILFLEAGLSKCNPLTIRTTGR